MKEENIGWGSTRITYEPADAEAAWDFVDKFGDAAVTLVRTVEMLKAQGVSRTDIWNAYLKHRTARHPLTTFTKGAA